MPEVEHLNDVGVNEPRGQLRFEAKSADEALLRRQMRVDPLDRHRSFEASLGAIERLEDNSHASGAYLLLQPILAEELALAGCLVGASDGASQMCGGQAAQRPA